MTQKPKRAPRPKRGKTYLAVPTKHVQALRDVLAGGAAMQKRLKEWEITESQDAAAEAIREVLLFTGRVVKRDDVIVLPAWRITRALEISSEAGFMAGTEAGKAMHRVLNRRKI